MVDKGEQSEPTMEEILASIRRIISEENSGEETDSEPAEGNSSVRSPAAALRAAVSNSPGEPVRPAVSEPDVAEDDVLELTEMVAEEEKPAPFAEEIDLEVEAEATASAASEPEDQPAADIADLPPLPSQASDAAEALFSEAAPAFEATHTDKKAELSMKSGDKSSDWEDPIDPSDEEDAIMSDSVSEETRAAFHNLSALLVAGYQGSDNTLEAMVRTMLKPMLKSWLDENLPDIVERVVSREVARLARAKRP